MGIPCETPPGGGLGVHPQDSKYSADTTLLLGRTAPEGHPSIYLFLLNYSFSGLAWFSKAWECVVLDELVAFRDFDAFAYMGYVATN